MKLVYTDHAKNKITERKISKKIIKNTIKTPDKISENKFGRKIVNKLVKNKLLRVVYSEKKDIYIVITAYYTKPKRYQVKK